MANKYLDFVGLQRLVNKIKELIPTKTSELDNDNGFITIEDIPDSTWESIQNKPDTFAPSEHVHSIGSVTDLQNELNSKETPSGAQSKANVAESNAKDYVDGKVKTDVPVGAKFTDTVYSHPSSHPASMITQDTNNRFVTDAEKSTWNGKQNALGYIPANDNVVFKNGSVVMNTNPFGGRQLYINSINNAIFRAESRFNVTAQILNADNSFHSNADAGKLFDGNYDNQIIIPAGKKLVIAIDFGGAWSGYPYGYIYLSYYHTYHSGSATMRVHTNYEPHGVGWHSVDFVDYARSNTLITRARQGIYKITQMEITINAGSADTWIAEIDYQLDRPGTSEMPVIDKFGQNKLYNNLDMNNHKLINIANPTNQNDAATKQYVDLGLNDKVDNSRVLTDVPLDAKFTDTITDTSNLMPKSGGVLENYREKLVALSGTSTTINLSLGNVFTHTLTGNTTYSITNAVNSQAHSFTLIITQTATVRTLTFPASVKWQGGEIPDLTTASKRYYLWFNTIDGGTRWDAGFGGEF